jgi:hypothetical protein
MTAAITIITFTLDRLRTVLLALSVIILLKAAWILLTPTVSG